MFKKKLIILISLLFTIFLVGCGRNLETKTIETVTLSVVDTYHRNSWAQPIMVGKAMSTIFHPEQNVVEFEHNGYDFEVNNREVYDHCKDRKSVQAKIYKNTYDNGDIEYSLKEIIN